LTLVDIQVDRRYSKDLSSGGCPDTGTGMTVQFLVGIRESGSMASVIG